MSETAIAKPAPPPPREIVRKLFENHLKQFAAAIPRGTITAERLMRVAMTACSNTPKLLECTQQSLILSMLRAAQLGLEPDGLLGQAYLLPYWNKKTGSTEAQLQVGYQGLMTLARRSGDITGVVARAVYEKDEFEYHYGLERDVFKHKPSELPGDPGKVTHAYCIVRLKEGDPILTVLSVNKIESEHRGRSKSKDNGPWVTDYAAMCVKTALRVGLKYAPKSVESPESERLAKALALDERTETGVPIPFTEEEARVIGQSTTIEPEGVTGEDILGGDVAGRNDADHPGDARRKAPGCSHPGLPPSKVADIHKGGKTAVCPDCGEEFPPIAQEATPDAPAPATRKKAAPVAPSDAPAAGAPTAAPAAPDELFE